MLSDKTFWAGVAAGVAGVWVMHRFIRPMPTAAKA